MFRSVFTKYITVFMLIILVSFLILALIITSMVNEYAIDAKESVVSRTADAAGSFVRNEFASQSQQDFPTFIKDNRANIQSVISMLVRFNEDINILITDISGNILLTDTHTPADYVKAGIPPAIMVSLSGGQELTMLNTMGGVFEKPHLIRALPITKGTGEVVGAIFICSSSSSLSELLDVVVKTVIMSSLWVMLAALVAVYFISERIIGPLKSMSKAARNFAAGKFDARIPVTGRDEVAELAIAFNTMAESLANLENMRRSFLANVSHDLRTPMTTISGYIDGILDGAIPPEKHQYYLNVIATEVRRLSRLVSQLLDISRMQAGERRFTRIVFDICELARQILISFETRIDERKLNVEFNCDEDSLFVYADQDAIHQILYNLIDNAVKFSKESGTLRISIREREKKIHVSVFNEGVGIPPEDLPLIFDRFYKSDRSRGLDKTGVGLGLYIAKTIIDAHGEKITARSSYGEYCEFEFTLPHMHTKNSAPRSHEI